MISSNATIILEENHRHDGFSLKSHRLERIKTTGILDGLSQVMVFFLSSRYYY